MRDDDTIIHSSDSSASARCGCTIRVVTHAERRGFYLLRFVTLIHSAESSASACVDTPSDLLHMRSAVGLIYRLL